MGTESQKIVSDYLLDKVMDELEKIYGEVF